MRLFLRLVRIPVRRRLLLLLGLLVLGLTAARWLRRGVGIGCAVVVVRFAVGRLLLGVRVLGLGPVRHGALLPGVPATVVLRLGGGLLTVRVLLGRAVLLVLLRLLVLLVVLVLLVLVVRLLRVLLVALLLMLVVVLLLGVRVLRIGLLLVAVLALAVGGLLASPSLVPVQGVLGMPRFGAGAPAILSHRSPRAARRRSVSSLRCAVFVRTTDASRGTLPYRDQTTTSTPSPGGLPDARSDSRAF